jgi:pimeloyl-ACP methyl ester carboxylesterase
MPIPTKRPGKPRGLYAPGYSIRDLYHAIQSIRFTLDTYIGPTMSGPLMSVNLDDYITSPQLAKGYVDTLISPQKEFVMLKDGGHFTVFTHPEAFVAEMNSRVRPLAVGQP